MLSTVRTEICRNDISHHHHKVLINTQLLDLLHTVIIHVRKCPKTHELNIPQYTTAVLA